MISTKIIIIRHGETLWNVEGKKQGQLDSPLTLLGIKQAKALAQRLTEESFTALYASDLGRASKTAEYIADRTNHKIILESGLRERNFGIFQGLTDGRIKIEYPAEYNAHLADAVDYVIPEGESLRRFSARAVHCLESLTARHAGQTVAAVAHGGVIDAYFYRRWRRKKAAVLEMAAAAGLSLVPKDQRNPFETTTYGVGELIKAALDSGVDKILIGNGDSGTNDGGAGAAQALGVKLLKKNGDDIERNGTGLKELAKVDLSGRDERLDRVRIDVACNIKNILCGAEGVARVFGPQKGATAAQVEEMSDALDNYSKIIRRDTGRDVAQMPGGGASGGLGAELHALLGAELHSRFDIVFKYFKLDEALKNADLVITAEGGLNFQTPNGKIPSEVARRAKERNLPVLAIAGSLNKGARDNYEIGIDALFSILREPCDLDEAIEHAPELLEKCAENVMRTLLIGKEIGKKLSKTRQEQNTLDADGIERE